MKTKINRNKVIEAVFLTFIFILLLWSGLGVIWGHRISHDRPYGVMAGDGYEKIILTEYLLQTSDFGHHSITLAGGYEGVIRYQPPAVTTLGAMFAKATGLNATDSTYLLVVMFACFACMIFYFMIKKFNRKLAILSLPLCLVLFTGRFSAAFTWGLWFYVYGAVFLVFFLYSLCHMDKKMFFLISSVFLGASFMGHIPEAIFGIGFMCFYLGVDFLLRRKINFSKIAKFALIILLFLILTSHFFAISQYTQFKFQGSPLTQGIRIVPDSEMDKPGGGYPLVRPSSFAYILVALTAGLVLSFMAVMKKGKMTSKMPYLIGIYMLIIGYGNYYGLAARAQQTRFFWPIYFSVFLGLPLVYLLMFAKKRHRMPVAYVVSAVLAIVIFSSFFNATGPAPSIDEYHMNAFNWVKENTPYNASFLYVYSDLLGQRRATWFTMRGIIHIVQRDFLEVMQSGEIRENYSIDAAAETTTHLPYRKDDGSIGYYVDENPEVFDGTPKSLCNYEYYLIDKYSRYPGAAEYAMEIAKELIVHNFTVEYSNEIVIVLKNNNPGGKCINERSL